MRVRACVCVYARGGQIIDYCGVTIKGHEVLGAVSYPNVSPFCLPVHLVNGPSSQGQFCYSITQHVNKPCNHVTLFPALELNGLMN